MRSSICVAGCEPFTRNSRKVEELTNENEALGKGIEILPDCCAVCRSVRADRNDIVELAYASVVRPQGGDFLAGDRFGDSVQASLWRLRWWAEGASLATSHDRTMGADDSGRA